MNPELAALNSDRIGWLAESSIFIKNCWLTLDSKESFNVALPFEFPAIKINL